MKLTNLAEMAFEKNVVNTLKKANKTKLTEEDFAKLKIIFKSGYKTENDEEAKKNLLILSNTYNEFRPNVVADIFKMGMDFQIIENFDTKENVIKFINKLEE